MLRFSGDISTFSNALAVSVDNTNRPPQNRLSATQTSPTCRVVVIFAENTAGLDCIGVSLTYVMSLSVHRKSTATLGWDRSNVAVTSPCCNTYASDRVVTAN